MRRHHSQAGITLLGFLLLLVLVGFFAFLIMRLFPVYTEYYNVVGAMKGVAAEPGIASRTPAEIREALDRRFNISYVSTPKAQNVRVTRQGRNYVLNVRYERRGPLMYNLEYVATFDRTEVLGGGGGAP